MNLIYDYNFRLKMNQHISADHALILLYQPLSVSFIPGHLGGKAIGSVQGMILSVIIKLVQTIIMVQIQIQKKLSSCFLKQEILIP